MLTTTRPAIVGLFSLFALGQLTSGLPRFHSIWQFFSPIEWVSSLVLVMTGQAETVSALVETASFAGHGSASLAVGALLAGVLGVMLCITVELIVRHARTSSPIGGKLFFAVFVPTWLLLIQYKTLSRVSPGFRDCVSGLESMASYEMRLSAGFGILLMSVITPILVLLCAKVLELILHPEKSYS